jgi:hypothetical protein
MEEAFFANGFANRTARAGLILGGRLLCVDGPGEDVSGGGLRGANHISVHAERDSGVCVTETGSDDMNGDA